MNPEEYLDQLLTLPIIYDDLLPQVSRDGRWVAWTWFHVGPASDVFAAPTDASQPPIRLTDTPENTILVSWTPDSRGVIVSQDKAGNERDQLFRIDLKKPREMIPLTEPDPDYYIRGGQLHPNGRWLIYGANFDVNTGKELEETWLYRHNLETGERLPLARPLKPAYMTPKLNSQGTHILYNRRDLHPAGIQTWLVDIEGKEDRELLNFGAEVKTFASWHPDGEHILVIVETPTHRRLGLTNLDGTEIHWLLDDPSLDIETAFIPPNGNTIVVLINHQGRLTSILINSRTTARQELPRIPGNLIPIAPLTTSLPSGESGEVQAIDQEQTSFPSPHSGGTEGGSWLALYFSAQQPGEIVRFNIADISPHTFHPISRAWDRTNLTADDLLPAEDFTWESVDGLQVHGWLYRAREDGKGTIIYVHGGPTWHSRDEVNAEIQFFLHQGFNVMDPNYRGSTGYGLPFRESIREDGWGGREQEDIRTGIQALIKAGIAENGKVGITGTSYGGYSSWWAITHFPPEIVAASAPICGMTDLVVDYETTRPDLRPFSEEMMGGSPTQVPERFHQRSPIHFIDQILGRLLIIQGARDPNVTPKNVSDVVLALKAANVPYEELIFDDEGHGISKRENQRILYLRLVDFFERAFTFR